MSVPVRNAVVYHSGYGHTVKIAETVARGAEAIDGASKPSSRVKRQDATGLVVSATNAVPQTWIAGIDIDAGAERVRSDAIAYATSAADFTAP